MNTDTRYLKGTMLKGITQPHSHSLKNKSICEYCAAANYCSKAATPMHQVYECYYPILPLTFQDPAGLDQLSFSTIRLGSAWEERLNFNHGGVVALVHKTKVKQRFLGYAKVVSVQTLSKRHAISISTDNHLVRAKGLKGQEAFDFLSSVLRRYYGGFDQKGDKPYTVIKMVGMIHDEGKRVEETWPVASFRLNETFRGV